MNGKSYSKIKLDYCVIQINRTGEGGGGGGGRHGNLYSH